MVRLLMTALLVTAFRVPKHLLPPNALLRPASYLKGGSGRRRPDCEFIARLAADAYSSWPAVVAVSDQLNASIILHLGTKAKTSANLPAGRQPLSPAMDRTQVVQVLSSHLQLPKVVDLCAPCCPHHRHRLSLSLLAFVCRSPLVDRPGTEKPKSQQTVDCYCIKNERFAGIVNIIRKAMRLTTVNSDVLTAPRSGEPVVSGFACWTIDVTLRWPCNVHHDRSHLTDFRTAFGTLMNSSSCRLRSQDAAPDLRFETTDSFSQQPITYSFFRSSLSGHECRQSSRTMDEENDLIELLTLLRILS
ncbi:unnamed protein product [Soboliphyme baturini]|uniref:Secreted protein n=1 Tax=Soboliphyme baturini TaxID=241478 RepID=A0A183IHF5_9BILA|nr:unnamed protein product [Soboliphyme baturini]